MQTNGLGIMARLTARPSESSVDYVVNSIKELLLTQKVRPGDRLPTEMELARLLSVSRGSVREAMKILSAFGIVEIKRGDGTYVANMSGKVLFDPLLFNLILSQPNFDELKEFRLLLEKDVVRLVIKNASTEDINLLRVAYEEMNALKDQEPRSYDQLLDSDLKFHIVLGQICNNRLFEKIYLFIMEYFKPFIAQSLRKHTNFSLESNETHRRVLDAVERRDIAAAERAIENSLDVWQNLIFK
ncbi:FadR/GntR family transcriptional regulator [Anaeroselena agilis]|uniref:FadR/GntR family transcriptional regulator n=1 Tax=Anaeroselena agilis TaxID=3063788 RepID=A0ABU3NT10_9FIRM|nr:FadR/GntR family transcriptional regulator [Selenomonadales bacterium 4137-cl]